MSDSPGKMLLCTKDAAPVMVVNPSGSSPFLLIGDHAGQGIPSSLGSLGLPAEELSRHIGWDIGVAEMGNRLARTLDAVFVRQIYSRLVIDCNRDPDAADAIPAISDGTAIPGNANLDPTAHAARVEAIHSPYQAAIAGEIACRSASGLDTMLIALHSFTPRMAGFDRPWQIGILHNGENDAFAVRLLAHLKSRGDLTVGDNEPYRMDLIDYTVPRHAFAAGLPYAEIEVRQDLIGTSEGAGDWAALLAEALNAAL